MTVEVLELSIEPIVTTLQVNVAQRPTTSRYLYICICAPLLPTAGYSIAAMMCIAGRDHGILLSKASYERDPR
jgi:hypothetical protein